MFFEQYWGGPTTYSEQRGHPRLRMRHMPFPVTPDMRDRWLLHMMNAVDTLGPRARERRPPARLPHPGGILARQRARARRHLLSPARPARTHSKSQPIHGSSALRSGVLWWQADPRVGLPRPTTTTKGRDMAVDQQEGGERRGRRRCGGRRSASASRRWPGPTTRPRPPRPRRRPRRRATRTRATTRQHGPGDGRGWGPGGRHGGRHGRSGHADSVGARTSRPSRRRWASTRRSSRTRSRPCATSSRPARPRSGPRRSPTRRRCRTSSRRSSPAELGIDAAKVKTAIADLRAAHEAERAEGVRRPARAGRHGRQAHAGRGRRRQEGGQGRHHRHGRRPHWRPALSDATRRLRGVARFRVTPLSVSRGGRAAHGTTWLRSSGARSARQLVVQSRATAARRSRRAAPGRVDGAGA